MQTIEDQIKEATLNLRQNKVENPRLDAEVLLMHVLNCDHLFLLMHMKDALTVQQCLDFEELVKRRIKHEPIAYIIGQKGFMDAVFVVTPAVLIPRPDTESIVEAVIQRLKKENHQSLKILDLCTGSGAIGISLKQAFQEAHVTLTDISEGALAVAKINAERLCAGEVTVLLSDLFKAIPKRETFDLIISNPPYIPQKVMQNLSVDVKNFEPTLALVGGDTGFDFYDRIIDQAKAYLKPHGKLVLEAGDDQDLMLIKQLEQGGYRVIALIPDLIKRNRGILAEKIL